MARASKLLLLYTGGTIGMIKDENSGSLRSFNFENLLQQIPEIHQLNCLIDTDSLDHPIDSSNMGPGHWVRLARRIARDYHAYDGFVILHGSDTMAYTSSALSFMLDNLSKPVLLTGSQLPIGIPRSDARENLLTTIEIALEKNAEGHAQVPEVAVYFENDLFRGNRLHKISTQDFEAFQSLNYPKLAEAGVNLKFNTNYISTPADEAFDVTEDLDPGIGVLTAFPGMLQTYALPMLENPDLKAFLYRTFGSGNGPTDKWLLSAFEKAIERGVKVINISQCDGGGVYQGQYESSRELLDMGVISGHDMTFEAALTKLMHLLSKELEDDEFRKAYESSLKGELTA